MARAPVSQVICVVRTIRERRLPRWLDRRRAAGLTVLALAAILAFPAGGSPAARLRGSMQNGNGSVVRGIAESTPGTEVTGASQRAGVLEDTVLSLERAQGEGWHAEDLQVALSATGTQLSAVLTVARLQLDTLEKTLSGVRIECPRLELSTAAFGCADARMEANWPVIGRQVLNAQVRYGRRDAALSISLDGFRLGSGSARLRGELQGAAWTGELHAAAMPLSTLLQLVQAVSLPLAGWSAQGEVTVSARAGGTGRTLTAAGFDASLSGLSVNNDSGSIASDGLAMRVRGEARRGAGSPVVDDARNEARGRARDEAGADHDLRGYTLMDAAMDRGHGGQRDLYFTMQIESGQGQVYVQPVFLDFGMHAMSLEAAGTLAAGQVFVVERFAVNHTDVAQASGAARIEPAARQPLRFLRLDLAGLHFPGAYESYLQPVLLNTGFKSMRTSGRLAGRVVVAEGVPQDVELTFDDLSLDDGQGAFALSALTGEANWRLRASAADDAAAQASHVQWRDGALFGLALGPADLHVLANGRQFRLLQPTRIPVLDGALHVERFRIRNMGSAKLAFLIDATIEPISVPQLCEAFGWPQFGGQLAGKVSDLRMREGVITLGTTLHAQVFDGEVSVTDLRLEEPFGQWPRFYSNVTLDNLDLELVTRAFSFGRINGRLSGEVDDLQLFNWVPVAFDARLYTPPGDRSRHRISQRAVQNIGSIGGGGAGVTAALSSGVMRFFDDFNYDRLGVSCRLQNEVCTMDGVEPRADGTYYLVKGRGLPRIDVIGSSRRVDWPRLVQQLMAVTQSEGPVVQ